jgi:hypothetical protein
MARPKRKKQKILTSASFDYKEQVSFCLAHYDVPFRIAEIAVIDLGYEVKVGYHNKWSADLTSITMLEKVKKIYMTDGKWHYSHAPIA